MCPFKTFPCVRPKRPRVSVQNMARQDRHEPPPEFPMTLPFTSCVHHLLNPNALSLSTFKITSGCKCTCPGIHFHCACSMQKHPSTLTQTQRHNQRRTHAQTHAQTHRHTDTTFEGKGEEKGEARGNPQGTHRSRNWRGVCFALCKYHASGVLCRGRGICMRHITRHPLYAPPKGNPTCLPSRCKEMYGGPRKTKLTVVS